MNANARMSLCNEAVVCRRLREMRERDTERGGGVGRETGGDKQNLYT